MTQATKPFQIQLPPPRARLLSVVAIASLVAGYVGAAIVGDATGPADLGLGLLRIVGLECAMVLFLSNYGQMSQRREAELDEREAQIRNRAYVLTHHVMVAMLFLAFFYTEAAGKLGWWLPNADEVGSLFSAIGLAAMALPAAVLAWRDRSVPDEG